MKIIGGKDYYDNVVKTGVDHTYSFIRNQKPILALDDVVFLKDLYNLNKPKNMDTTYLQKSVIIVGDSYWNIFSSLEYFETKTINNYKDFLSYKNENSNNFEISKYSRFDRKNKEYNIKEEYFGEKKVSNQILEWMISNNHTIVFIGNREDYMSRDKYIETDVDALKTYNFFKNVDPYQMYQKIEQWISNYLTNKEKDVFQITDDKVKISKHGFDNWSFKKVGKKGFY